jgi:NNP family nitrate/nitrite transporter-like MFS transporter
VLLQVPVVGVLALVAHRVERVGVISRGTLHVAWAACLVLGTYLIVKVLLVNRPALTSTYPTKERYSFASVVILSLAYFVTFGAELTVVSLLPTFFADTFGLEVAAAGAAASAFAFTNLVTRPGGGLVSDLLGRRRATLVALLAGTAVSFLVLSRISAAWPLFAGVALVALASVFVQGGNGAVFAMVPLVRRNVGGQIAGIAGSYGNIGGVLFSSILFFTMDEAHPAGNTRLLFVVIAATAAVVAVLCRWLPDLDGEPSTAHTGTAIPVSTSTSAVHLPVIGATQPSA